MDSMAPPTTTTQITLFVVEGHVFFFFFFFYFPILIYLLPFAQGNINGGKRTKYNWSETWPARTAGKNQKKKYHCGTIDL